MAVAVSGSAMPQWPNLDEHACWDSITVETACRGGLGTGAAKRGWRDWNWPKQDGFRGSGEDDLRWNVAIATCRKACILIPVG